MKKRHHSTVYTLLLAFVFQSIGATQVHADHIFGRMGRMVKELHYHGTPPATCEDGCVETLAENIDWLEHHIDRYGSIVAKQPDIWGEARLTKHRDEYEQIMYKELGNFELRLNATISQSDASFLAQAVALSAAIDKKELPAITATTAATEATVGNTAANLKGAGGSLPSFAKYGKFVDVENTKSFPILGIEPVIGLDQQSRYLQHLHELRRINEGDDTSDSPGYSMNLVRIPVSMLPGKLTRTGFGAEIAVTATPVLSDDLLPTTFRNLVINDVVDQLRLPVVRVTEGLQYAKQRAATASQVLQSASTDIANAAIASGDPQASTQITAAVEKILNNELALKTLESAISKELLAASQFSEDSQDMPAPPAPEEVPAVSANKASGNKAVTIGDSAVNLTSFSAAQVESKVQSTFDASARANGITPFATLSKIVTKSVVDGEGTKTVSETITVSEKDVFVRLQRAFQQKNAIGISKELSALLEFGSNRLSKLNAIVGQSLETLSYPADLEEISAAPSGRVRRATNPLNPSLLVGVIGLRNLVTISNFFQPAYNGKYIRWNGGNGSTAKENRVDLLDAQRYLEAEIDAAYELLSEPDHLRTYSKYASPDSGLTYAIRGGHISDSKPGYPSVEDIRHRFFADLHKHEDRLRPFALGHLADPSFSMDDSTGNQEARNVVESLAWAVVVESALLNERLNRDVRKLAMAKEAYDLNTSQDCKFFLPGSVYTPSLGLEDLQADLQAAAQVFKRYVEVRWPIHVFAIDPREQDQNVADVSARKRELQFALALGFMSGKIGASSLTQFSRKMETQVETIALNRTVVGFGHGNDTFGWRFFPRTQALEVPGTLGAIKQTLCGVSRDDDLKHRKLEPGMRECVAVVLMPSFVPYADFDIRTNWFKLTNPKNTALTMKDTIRFSRAIASMRNSQAQCSKCAHLYRAGDIQRMMKRVDQLDRELPLQTMRAQVPYENTLGGFEMFNTGVTDLSPELIGWHGAPGIVTKSGNGNVYACGCDTGCPATGEVGSQAIADAIKTHLAEKHPAKDVEDPLPACKGAGTTLFLVGDNFSVHDTRVIAGGVCIPHVRLISREIMQVTIPSCVNTVHLTENGKCNEYVAIYVATPYGITNHLHVPVHNRPEAPSDPGGDQASVESSSTHPPLEDGGAAASPDELDRTTHLRSVGSAGYPVASTTQIRQLGEPGLPLKFIQELNDAKIRLSAIEAFQAGRAVPALAEFSVNVQTAEARSQFSPREASKHTSRSGPAVNQLRTRVHECWRNVRDKLPGN